MILHRYSDNYKEKYGWIKGVDISSLPQMLEHGKKYYDFDGNERAPLDLLKENQINWIRLRIWNEPKNFPESGGYCDLPQTVAFAKQIKEEGFFFLLDFHYSDWWADPAQQRKPKAWEGLPLDKLTKALYDYTKEVLEALEEAGAYPDMVQIGNEIRSGMVFPEGAVSNWDGLSRLINAGIQAVRDTQKERNTQVMIHLDQGGRWYYFEEWFDAAIAHGVTDFDCIGLSYYPFWHGGFQDLRHTLDFLADKYHRPLIVAETAHAWKVGNNGMFSKEQEAIAGYPATPEGQKQVLELVMNITASAKDGMGKGIFYWEPMMLPLDQQGGWAEDMGLFGHDGHPSKGLLAYHFNPIRAGTDIAKIAPVSFGYVLTGSVPILPKTVSVLQWDGLLSDRPVSWEIPKDCFQKEGRFVLEGTVEGFEGKAELSVICCKELPIHENLLPNGNLEEGWSRWNRMLSEDEVTIELKPEFTRPFPQPPETILEFSCQNNFTFDFFQQLDGLVKGNYKLSVEVSGDNTTGVQIELYAESETGRTAVPVFLTGNGYKTYQLDVAFVSGKQIRMGLLIQSPPIRGKIKNFCLTRSSASITDQTKEL